MRMVYGGPDAPTMGLTFVDALGKVCDGGHLRIVAPYIAPDRLRQLMKDSARVSIITDFTACFSSLNAAERSKMAALVCDHAGAFRHLPAVHAKVVFSQSRVLLGSANLTAKGLEERDELGVILHEATQLAEARIWFDALWARGRVVYAEDFTAWVQSLPAYQPVVVPPFGGRTTETRTTSGVTAAEVRPRPTKDLDEVLALAPSQAVLRQYLGVIRWAYSELGVDADDPRLVVSVPKSNHIYLSINNRWVLQHTDDYTVTGFLLSADDTSRFAQSRKHVSIYQFDPRKKGEDPPCLVRTRGFDLLADSKVAGQFRDAMRTELRNGRRASNRRYHRADLLDLILDEGKLVQHLNALGVI